MENVIQYANTLLSILITKLIDNMFILDMSIKFALASAICGLIKAFIVYILPHVNAYNPFKQNTFIVQSGSNIHRHLNDLILTEYPDYIISQFISDKDNKIYIDSMRSIDYEYEDIHIKISSGSNQLIKLTSTGDISKFIQKIYTINSTNTISIYTYLSLKQSSWKCNAEKAYKTCTNTFYADDIHELFIDSVNTFIKSEETYMALGDGYSTGYILYGPPGTGKTSLIKIIAKQHDIPVFIIDMANILSTDEFIKLNDELCSVVSQYDHYIVLFEDFDRSGFMYNHNRKVSISSFLNFLDGVQSAHGRIVIITCNDLKIIKKIPAMIRPGRITSMVKVDMCNQSQLINTINFRYNVCIDQIPSVSISPANLIQLIKYVTYDELIEIFNKYNKFNDVDELVKKYRIGDFTQDVVENTICTKSELNSDDFNIYIEHVTYNEGTTSQNILMYDETDKIKKLCDISETIEFQIKYYRILSKVKSFVHKHADNVEANRYLDLMLENSDSMQLPDI